VTVHKVYRGKATCNVGHGKNCSTISNHSQVTEKRGAGEKGNRRKFSSVDKRITLFVFHLMMSCSKDRSEHTDVRNKKNIVHKSNDSMREA
jgi:hypothetical protein